MFFSTEGREFEGDHLNVSFNHREGWSSAGFGMSGLNFAIGDGERGPMVGLVAIPVQPGDDHKFPPVIHMHRSDSFRTIFNGDFYIGRKIYADGEARLQGAGDYYGPEQPGPQACRDSQEIWSLLVFGDKRGHTLKPADKKYEAEREAGMAANSMLRDLGIQATLPYESSGHKDIRTNVGLKLKGGHADFSFDQADGWPAIGDSKVIASSIGETDCGPIVLGLSVPGGVVAMPRAVWDTEVMTTVIHGSCEIGGERYERGDVRIQKAGAEHPAVVAGPDGLDAYVILGDRRHATPRATGAHAGSAAWADRLAGLAVEFSRPAEAVSA